MHTVFVWIRVIIVSILFFINTAFQGTLVALLSPVIWMVPNQTWRLFWRKIMLFVARGYIHNNAILLKVFYRIDWDIEGLDELEKHGTYLVIGNHLSLNDITVVQSIFINRIPFLRFFIKHELLYVPFLGQALWALDYPTMKRFSKTELKKNPGLRGKDLETAKLSCDKFRGNPVTILNYAEGTRFTEEKHTKSKSSYKHLLKPRSGGIHSVLDSLGDELTSIIDLTLVYPGFPSPDFKDMVFGRIDKIVVRIEHMKLGEDGAPTLETIRKKGGTLAVRKWLNVRWKKKDLLICQILNEPIEEDFQATKEPFSTGIVGESNTTPLSPE